MDVNDLLGIGIVGVILSLVIQWLKGVFGTDTLATKAITVALSLVIAGLFVWVRETVYWTTVLAVLGVASTFYAFFLKK